MQDGRYRQNPWKHTGQPAWFTQEEDISEWRVRIDIWVCPLTPLVCWYMLSCTHTPTYTCTRIAIVWVRERLWLRVNPHVEIWGDSQKFREPREKIALAASTASANVLRPGGVCTKPWDQSVEFSKNPTTWWVEARGLEVKGHPWLHKEFEANLGCRTPVV